MKPILIAAASLVAAGAAFGFAKAVDHMSQGPTLRTPSAPIAVERLDPALRATTTNAPYKQATSPATVPVAPQIPVETIAPAIALAPSQSSTRPAAPAMQAKSDPFQNFPRGTAGDGPAMSFMPQESVVPDDGPSSTRYQFGAVPLIGVYR